MTYSVMHHNEFTRCRVMWLSTETKAADILFSNQMKKNTLCVSEPPLMEKFKLDLKTIVLMHNCSLPLIDLS